MSKRIHSVIELAKYEVGMTVYWVVLRPVGRPTRSPSRSDAWMNREHPKVFFERLIFAPLWRSRKKLPRLHAQDFSLVTQLVTQSPCIEEFTIHKIVRSPRTGEFIYLNHRKEEMPEQYLFARRCEAEKEVLRIKQIILESLEKWD